MTPEEPDTDLLFHLRPSSPPDHHGLRSLQRKHTITTDYDRDGDPPWVAYSPNVENLLQLSQLEDPPPFCATGATELEAITNLAQQCGWLPVQRRKPSPITNLHQMQKLLRTAYLAGHGPTDLAVFLCLLRHHPRLVPRRVIMDETALARQTAQRALTAWPHLIYSVERPDSPINLHQAHKTGATVPQFHRLTAAGLRLIINYLRALLPSKS